MAEELHYPSTLSFPLPDWTVLVIIGNRTVSCEGVWVEMGKEGRKWYWWAKSVTFGWHNSWHSQIHFWPNLHFQRPYSLAIADCYIIAWAHQVTLYGPYVVLSVWNISFTSLSTEISFIFQVLSQMPFSFPVSEFAYSHRAICSD